MPYPLQLAYAFDRDNQPATIAIHFVLNRRLSIIQEPPKTLAPSPVPSCITAATDRCVIPSRLCPRSGARSALNSLSHITISDLFNALADDTYTFHRLGFFPPSVGNKADRVANWLWFLGTLAGLVEVETDLAAVQALQKDLDNRIYDVELDPRTVGRGPGKKSDAAGLVPHGQPNNVDLSVGVDEAEEGLKKLKKQSSTLRITRWKLYMDLIFVCEWYLRASYRTVVVRVHIN